MVLCLQAVKSPFVNIGFALGKAGKFLGFGSLIEVNLVPVFPWFQLLACAPASEYCGC